jgi:hypothetical protein
MLCVPHMVSLNRGKGSTRAVISLKLRFSKCGMRTRDINITLDFVININLEALPKIYRWGGVQH